MFAAHGDTGTKGRCKKYFPMPMSTDTVCDHRGYWQLKRPNEGSRNVVSYNWDALKLTGWHTNVALSHTVRVITYLYKYVWKSADYTNARLSGANPKDEIALYERMRDVGTPHNPPAHSFPHEYTSQ